MHERFTFHLRFDGCFYPVSVSLRSKGYDLCFLVRYLSEEAHTLLPGGLQEFSLSEGLQRPAMPLDASAYNLVQQTIDAISEYMKEHLR